MRRWLIFLVLLWLVGLSTAVGVAWFFAGLDERPLEDSFGIERTQRTRSVGNGWFVVDRSDQVSRYLYLEPREERVAHGDGGSRFRPKYDPFAPPDWSVAAGACAEARPLMERASGWPWPVVMYRWREEPMDLVVASDVVECGRPIDPFSPEWMVEPPSREELMIRGMPTKPAIFLSGREALPLRPLVGPLALASVLYAVAWVPVIAVLSVPMALRRWWRRRRERCVRCGYILAAGASPRCPECGWRRGSRYPLLTRGRLALTAVLLVLVMGGSAAWAYALTSRAGGPEPIHVAARFGDAEGVQRLLAQGVPVDAPVSEPAPYSVTDTTPLMWAAAHGKVETMRVLLDAGADVHMRGSWRRTVIGSAVEGGQPDAVRVLVEHGAAVEDAVAALRSSDLKMAHVLLDAGANPTEMLRQCVMHSELDVLRLLLERGAALQPFDEKSPLCRALDNARVDVAMLLIDYAEGLASATCPLVWHAVEHERVDLVRALLDAGADVNHAHPVAEGWTPARRAVLRDNAELLEMLLDAGADPTMQTEEGETILFALDWDDAPDRLVDLVLDLGLDVNHADEHGNTALHLAVRERSRRGVRRLLDAGPDPALTNAFGHTALDYAREAGLPLQRRFLRQSSGEPDPVIVEMLEGHRREESQP